MMEDWSMKYFDGWDRVIVPSSALWTVCQTIPEKKFSSSSESEGSR